MISINERFFVGLASAIMRYALQLLKHCLVFATSRSLRTPPFTTCHQRGQCHVPSCMPCLRLPHRSQSVPSSAPVSSSVPTTARSVTNNEAMTQDSGSDAEGQQQGEEGDKIIRKTLFYLVSTLNAAFYPDYDFSSATSQEFSKEHSLKVSEQVRSSRLLRKLCGLALFNMIGVTGVRKRDGKQVSKKGEKLARCLETDYCLCLQFPQFG